jgi:hypothetical protein
MTADISFADGCYTVKFSYNRNLVEMIKVLIPYNGRKWDGADKSWKVDAKHESLLRQVFPDQTIPSPTASAAVSMRYSVDLRYLGQVKDRGNGDISSFGFSKGTWSVLFPETVLKEWFLGTDEKPKLDTSSLYGILGVANFADFDDVKAGFKRMAKQWHPDVCREPDANKVFMQIRGAYETLSDSALKVRYDVGLKFEFGAARNKPVNKSLYSDDFYRAPLRCGKLEVQATNVLGRLIVSKIFSWDDIADDQGRTLVTSWVMGDDTPIENWV